ncbi:MAG: antitoxin VbhA family protein [Thalassolituus sp.]|nr:antitoxin VbhA family protein [Thalassolituus oleivorans]AHK17149.1 hypothetical protein R615_00240 [Thalassolituus oleivorans R6-15]APR65584.1 hypothetical protein CN03_00825 [Thalassolituus oleivorans]
MLNSNFGKSGGFTMPNKPITSEFLAAQAAGSCRIEGLKVSAEEERLMSDIIAGRVDAEAEIEKIVQACKATNKNAT